MNTQENEIYLIDTNIFLRLIVKDDEKSFEDCLRLLEGVKNSKYKAITTTVTLAEIAWTLFSFYKFDKKDVVSAISSILSLQGLEIVDQYNHIATLEIFQEKNIKYIDALIASTAISIGKNCIVVSYDKDFDKIENIKRKEPSDI